MVVSRPRPPLLPSLLLLECAVEPPITRAEILTHASLAHSVPATDSSRAIRTVDSTVGDTSFTFQTIFVYLLLACPMKQHKLPFSRAHGLLRRLLTILTAWYRRRELALRAWFPPAR